MIQAWRRAVDRPTSSHLALPSTDVDRNAEVAAASSSSLSEAEKEEIDALSAPCIEDAEEDDMFAIATQGPGVVDTTVERTFDISGQSKASEAVQAIIVAQDSIGLMEQDSASIDEEEGMFFHKQAAKESFLQHNSDSALHQAPPPLLANNVSALLEADTQAVGAAHPPNESSLLFSEPTQVSSLTQLRNNTLHIQALAQAPPNSSKSDTLAVSNLSSRQALSDSSLMFNAQTQAVGDSDVLEADTQAVTAGNDSQLLGAATQALVGRLGLATPNSSSIFEAETQALQGGHGFPLFGSATQALVGQLGLGTSSTSLNLDSPRISSANSSTDSLLGLATQPVFKFPNVMSMQNQGCDDPPQRF